MIRRWRVESAIAADTEIDAGGLYERLHTRLDQPGASGGAATEMLSGRFSLQERDRLGFVPGLANAPFLVVRDETIGRAAKP